MPLPYNGVCGRRSATKPTVCKAVTDRRYTVFFRLFPFLTAVGKRQRGCTRLPMSGLRPPCNDKSGSCTPQDHIFV